MNLVHLGGLFGYWRHGFRVCWAGVNRNFPKRNKLHKIFNRNSIKISYCCTKNMSAKISSHNKSMMLKNEEENATEMNKLCNCRKKEECPMDNQCLKSNVVYRAKVNTEDATKEYIGCTSNTFKERYTTHKQGLNHAKYSKRCELTKYVQQLKSEEKLYILNVSFLYFNHFFSIFLFSGRNARVCFFVGPE